MARISNKALLLTLSLIALYPLSIFAQTNLVNVIDDFSEIINNITPVLVGLALLYFFWGVAKYILAAGDEEAKAAGRSIMIWGVIALFVIVSVWGLVRVLGTTFDVQQGGDQEVPFVEELPV